MIIIHRITLEDIQRLTCGTALTCGTDENTVKQVYLVLGSYANVIQVREICSLDINATYEDIILALSEDDELYLMNNSKKPLLLYHEQLLDRLNRYSIIYRLDILKFNYPVVGAISWIFGVEARSMEYKIQKVDEESSLVYLKRNGTTVIMPINAFMQQSCYLYVFAAKKIWH